MNTLRILGIVLLATGLLAGSASAQNNTKPFDPANPPGGGTSSAGAVGTGPAGVNPASGAFQVDTSGAALHVLPANHSEETIDSCDASGHDHDKAQAHGTASVGVAAGNHTSGNYQAGTASVDKPGRDCGHSAGSMNVTVGGSQGHFDDHHR